MKSNAPKVGLVIGKFSQLHNGHIDLINFALEIVDKVFIVIYNSPDHTSIPLNKRSSWIRSIFPTENVVVIEGWNAPNQHEDTPEVRHNQEEYLGKIMTGINLTHIISSESYGDHLSKYFNIKNTIYDKDRIKRYISSTMIRKDAKKYIKEVPRQLRKYIIEDVRIMNSRNQ